MLSIQEVLREIRDMANSESGVALDEDLIGWAKAIEAAMREPVAENRPVTIPGMPSPAYHEIRWLPGKHFPPGTKLFAFPPDAAAEIERLNEDAERYRFLRDEDNWGCDNDETTESRWGDLGECHGGDFDAFVDKARAALAGEEGKT